jgi:hypothetical protein
VGQRTPTPATLSNAAGVFNGPTAIQVNGFCGFSQFGGLDDYRQSFPAGETATDGVVVRFHGYFPSPTK